MEAVDAAFGEESPGTPEPVAEQPTEQPDQPLLAGKYTDPAELEKGYVELKGLLDRQAAELGELRQQVQTPAQQPAQVPVTQETVDWLDEQSFQNPRETALWARHADPTGFLYQRALDNWYEADPRGAAQYELDTRTALAQDELVGTIAPMLQPLVEQMQQQQFNDAMASVAAEFPDFGEVAPKLLEVASESPEIAPLLQRGDLASKQKVLRNLYFQAKGRQMAAGHVAQAQVASGAVQAKLAAQVAAPSGTTGPSGGSVTAQEKWLQSVFDPAAESAGYYRAD